MILDAVLGDRRWWWLRPERDKRVFDLTQQIGLRPEGHTWRVRRLFASERGGARHRRYTVGRDNRDSIPVRDHRCDQWQVVDGFSR